MVIRPMGYALWENIQAHLDRRLKATGHVNAYFPLLIPESFLAKEAEHVEGFAPQVAWVTQGGDEPLSERLAIRPTSETIICAMYAKWIQSYRDLPVLINQWANVLRWEKRTTLFLRTTEFLWQEGHTAHATEAEAEEEALRILDIYRDLVETDLAIPVVPGRKTESEKFAGALRTYSIGALIMVHGDRDGLILPPRVAPIQAVIVPIWRTEEQRTQVLAVAQAAEQALRDRVRVKADLRDEYTPGWKFAEWELRGVPVRIEIGPRDVEQRQAVLVRRDTRERRAVPLDDLPQRVLALLEELQTALFQRALEFRRANTHYVETLAQFEEILAERRGFLYAHWCGSATCEAQIKDRTGATIRVIPFDRPMDAGRCLWCQAPVEGRVLFARAY
jgi:prolyl-tRNA synthetase